MYQKKSELLCPECRKPVEVAIDSLPPNILANRILEVELLLGIVSDDVRAIGGRNVNVANRSLEEKLVAMIRFVIMWEGLIGVRNDGSNHILEVDLVVMFVNLVIVMVGVGLT